MLNKFTHIEIGKALTISGLITAMTSIFVYDIPTLIISLLGTYANGAAVDYFIDGFKKRKRVCIIADDKPGNCQCFSYFNMCKLIQHLCHNI